MLSYTMTPSRKVWICWIINTVVLLLVITMVTIFRDDGSKYFKWGPSDDLILISIKVDTWTRWFAVLAFIALVKGCDVLVNELGSPVLGFSVYNPDKKVITDFTKNELNFLTNAMWFVNAFRGIMMAVVTVTQIDLAFLAMGFSEIVSIFTVRILLNEKTFTKCDEEVKPIVEDNTDGEQAL